MNPDQIEQLRALAERATQPSPWQAVIDGHKAVVNDTDGLWVADCGSATADAEYIAAACPENILTLLVIISNQQREIEHHKNEIVRIETKLHKERQERAAYSNAHVVRSEMP